MTDQAARYDRIAEGYARWWAPVLAPAVAELIAEVAPHLGLEGGARVIDIGTGTGQLGLDAVESWSSVSVVGIDASSEMRAMADAEADRRLAAAERHRFRSVVAPADDLPFPDRSFDVALSSFVFQLVPRRARALREARRVLRRDGLLAYVTWLEGDRDPGDVFAPDMIFNELLDDLGFDDPEPDGPSGDIPSVERAAAELRRAGFGAVTARGGALNHTFTVDGYIGFLTEFDEETLFADLEPDVRENLIASLRGRLEPLSAERMTMRFPIVFASGRRSSR